ncbi:type II toxin-antitoxin system RelE/ParE family toxin [Microbulbifer sp.]|uniref:type II toxin-antitoxin system RelE/ParE family toxin n=1 Tax=Microbulbifer sp. TaxID=1908541 RepID=UPI003F2ACF5B
MTEAERLTAIGLVSENPQAGDVMQGTGGCRKVRIPGRSKETSGGYRVITVFGGDEIPVFLLTVFSKGDRANLTQAQRNQLAKLTQALISSYGRGKDSR